MTRTASSVAETAPAGTDFSSADLLRGALEFHAAGNFAMARTLYLRVLAAEPENAGAWHHLGLIAHIDADHAAAAEHVGKAITLKPDYVQAHSNLAAILRATGNFAAAAASAETAIGLDPDFAAAHSNLGNVREDQGDVEAALAAYREACRLDPHFVEAHANAADLLRTLKRYDEALSICDAIVDKRPDAARPYFCAGNILRELLRASEAIDAFRQAIALQPHFAEAYCNLGNLLLRQGAFDEAITAYLEAIAIKPSIAQTYCNLGAAYELGQRSAEALDAYSKALVLDPRLIGVEVQVFHQRRVACDWDGIEAMEASLLARVADCKDRLPPFAFLSMDSSPATQLRVARLWAGALHARRTFAHTPPAETVRTKKLKIGYLSGDFHRHATAHLMAELFERHDRTRFEIIAYSHGMDDCSEMRYRLGQAFDAFIDLRHLDDRQAAQRINDDGIDILVELKGYTQLARSEIAAHRPAPIQVNYLGYPGSMGCDFIDYVIADPIAVPVEQQGFYDEKIVHLPDCYQPNDSQRRIADLTPSRADCGLPERGFVFCCFNNSYKLTPRFFTIWMRLLAAVPDSVLWLFDANSQAKANLQKEAMQRGIDPGRLVFAPRVGPTDHLARQRLADLFLDCLPYNAHTTTSDALWVGLPVLTLIGESFAGRVAASLLHAIGLPELVTHSADDYETLALRLATEPERLADLRRKLAANRLNHPLFDAR
ncbi:MAG TPA: tetratricopeptide repeat protein, partial [Methylovirgula sp.]